ncbi:uncharacterized protein F4822DRAFT_43279 [Hypoxylon trugodes]|uniref:uncharacterized protein n=1 Tax=Hypoxylon trugodes TaxID=326681 RepID=UPI00218E81BB|nr:uncharacterized protein F4822DRAFT_43279 [Hypoxylon trugodes]KAI1394266.1 hypothetical protein F4822DRAFT_43279 [Hypoxylon trugodes]
MSQTASAFAELLQTSLSSRTVYVRCIPAPVNFYERRAVLRAVQKLTHETVETFKKLEDNSSFVVVTTKPGTATALVNDSPITRVIIAQDENADRTPSTDSWGAEYDLRGTITTPVNPMAPSKLTKTTPAFSDLGLSHKSFTLHMFAANRTFNHKEAVRRNPLHGPWPSNGNRETFVSTALRTSVPSGAMAPALRDWHTANQLSRDSISFADEGAEGAASVLLGKKRHSPKEVFLMERIRARWNQKKIPAVMKSLAAFADSQTQDTSSSLESLSDAELLTNSAADTDPLIDTLPKDATSAPDDSSTTLNETRDDEDKPKG